jgi:hypothetical protein
MSGEPKVKKKNKTRNFRKPKMRKEKRSTERNNDKFGN